VRIVVTFVNFSFSSHSSFIRFVCISQRTANFALSDTRLLVFIAEIASVYCAVRTGDLNRTAYVSFLQGQYRFVLSLNVLLKDPLFFKKKAKMYLSKKITKSNS
jgi:hypothetical protein